MNTEERDGRSEARDHLLAEASLPGPARDVPERPAEPLSEVCYTPSADTRSGFGSWVEMGRELWASRELVARLFWRDFTVRYRQSVLGYLWALIPALVTTATFAWLNHTRVLPIAETPWPYPLFVLLGATVWQLFAGGLMGGTQSLSGAGSLVTKVSFPRETLLFAAFGQALVDFAVRAVLLAAALLLYRVTPAWTLALVPLALVPLCLLALGMGFILSLLNAVMRDVAQALGFCLTFWMFLTPVVYPAPAAGAQSLVTALNPVTPFVVAAQDLAMRGNLTQPGQYALGCGLSVILFLVGWRVFHLAEPRIIERI